MDERVTDEEVEAATAGSPGLIVSKVGPDDDGHPCLGSTVVPDPVRPLSAISLSLSLQPPLPPGRQMGE